MIHSKTFFLSSFALLSLMANSSDNADLFAEFHLPTSEPIAYNDSTQTGQTSQSDTPMIDNQYPGYGMPQLVYAGAPNPISGIHLAFFGQLLYWDSGINQLTTFIRDSHPFLGTPTAEIYVNRVLKGFKTHFQPGFRVGFQRSFRAQGWDLVGQWTYFRNRKHENINSQKLAPQGKSLYTVWVNSTVIYWPDALQHNLWFLNYNQGDMVMGKEIFFSKYYSLRPNIGGRYVHSQSGFDIKASDPYNLPADYNLIKMHNDLSIGGFTFGLDNKFLFGQGFYLLGTLNIGLMYGSNQLSYSSYFDYPPNAPENPQRSTSSMSGRDLIPAFDGKLDLAYERLVNRGRQAWSFSVGYEYHVLVGAFTSLTLPSVKNQVTNTAALDFVELATLEHNNLFLQGLNINVKCSF